MSSQIDDTPRRRRFGRRASDLPMEPSGHADQLAGLTAEVVLLREENARLKSAQHAGPDLGSLLGHARRLPTAQVMADGAAADEAAQILVEGLVIRESLLEICQEIERSMVALEARLNALAPIAEDAASLTAPRTDRDAVEESEEQRRGPGFA